ncbi:MAG: restriction endonuclease subunit S, partial [Proteobacteria bacterium]|nr:restriction endonuclease subunit S [Pseudomonadota bacterium]
MNDTWPTRKLRELADIRVSNVDKKAVQNEKPVKLCNYMDVYSNEYVTGSLSFMEASATAAEIERFGLNKGDVIITKDSETPDDIGISTVVVEKIDALVCGYHLALIRPNAEQLDSIYLAKQLSTSRVARYFSLHASGSTRYGLPVSAIEAVEIPTPPKPEQTKIAESGGRDCLNSKKSFLSDKLLLFKLLPLSWAVLPSKLHLVFSCQGFDAA